MANFTAYGIGANFDAATLPKRLDIDKIEAMLDLVARALGRIELEVNAAS